MTNRSLNWRISTYSGGGGSCVEVARRPDGQVLVRNSNHRDAGTLALSPAALGALLDGCRSGGLDDLSS